MQKNIIEPSLLPESYHYQPSPESHYDAIDILFSEVKTVINICSNTAINIYQSYSFYQVIILYMKKNNEEKVEKFTLSDN